MGARVGKAWGQRKAPESYYNNTAGTMRSPGIFLAVVKKNDDPQKMGRLQVWIEDFGGDPDVEDNWINVIYASPFAGSTSIFEQGTNFPDYEDTIKSYGLWFPQPDIDSRVLVAFANGGKLDMGYWFACLYQRQTQVTVPGIPKLRRTPDDVLVPVAPKNHRDPDNDIERYVEHAPMSQALQVQGLQDDPVRGTTSSSAMRETPSKVLGILTPGQHQFVMDDGDEKGKNKLIRLRTIGGTQILLDDTSGHVYLISKKGENWVELSVDGQIHIYGSRDINIRSEANINLYADKDINLEAGQNINLKADASDVKIEAGNELSTFAQTNTKITSGETSNINSAVGHYETAGEIHMNGPIAAAHQAIIPYDLVANQGVTQSICNVVPEHEPWGGHSGSINPIGPGNQQMKEDPAPDQQPRLPGTDETGAKVSTMQKEDDDTSPISIDEVTTSPSAQASIKDSNGYCPVNVQDGDSESAGWGGLIAEPPGGE